MRLLAISGATRGLGAHIAARALETGYAVVGYASRPPATDPGFPVAQVDVADPAAVAAFFHTLRDKPLWGVINAAGVAAMNLLLTTPPATMARLVSINLLGSMYCSCEGAKLLIRNKGGRIVNFSTIAVALGLAGESVYAASKAGVESFTRCFAREIAGFGITANVIAPGPVATGLLAGLRQDQIDAVVGQQVIRRMAEPEDVWRSVSFLLAEDSAMISGQVLHIGGV